MAKSEKKKGKGSIRFKEARKALKNRPLLHRIFDVFHRAKKVQPTPTKTWAKNPGRFDVKGLDDGSDAAKKPLRKEAHAYFGKIGRRGAHKTNAKFANQQLMSQNNQMKDLRGAQRSANSDAERDRIGEKIRVLRDRMARNQKIIADAHEGV
jgi:hypothetical protein